MTTLPENPVITIRRNRRLLTLDLRELWDHRELLYFLTWRDVKIRYRQTILGVAWTIIQPLLSMFIFTFLFGRLGGLEIYTGGLPYPVFAFSGLLLWLFFSKAVTSSSNSLISSAGLITKVYFPRMIIPGAAVAAGLVDLGISILLLLAVMWRYQLAPGYGLLALPLLVFLLVLLALAAGLLLSSVSVQYRDVSYALPFLLQSAMFVSPVIYPLAYVPEKWRWALALNPLTGVIEGFRACLFSRPLNTPVVLVSASVTLTLLACALYVFRRLEKRFADTI